MVDTTNGQGRHVRSGLCISPVYIVPEVQRGGHTPHKSPWCDDHAGQGTKVQRSRPSDKLPPRLTPIAYLNASDMMCSYSREQYRGASSYESDSKAADTRCYPREGRGFGQQQRSNDFGLFLRVYLAFMSAKHQARQQTPQRTIRTAANKHRGPGICTSLKHRDGKDGSAARG